MSQKTDFDLQNFLPYLLNQAAEESSLAFQKVYKDRYGMLRTEWRVLFHLGIYGRMSAKEIGQRSKMHKTKISRAVARLEERRFLTRQASEEDRRLEYLQLTQQGQAAYRDLLEVAERYDSQLTAALTPEEVVGLRALLRKLAGMG
ncbi:MAG: MarR family transcriptional regulator [Pseudomonadota bacterium]|jgi:DNA-binding MarR family transcriptional regulator|uniref:HTH-type transcriptional regulator MhqR n=1 Tax=Thalassovita autumnalis TaxID=2072972 RepID=A0A0P1FXU3_9RHOB|nr:MarR family transcriptional regulator [Thalassovita autumnalis]MEC8295933.1 MarR family transcriptional regulator [Pseudomonadota bacterium]CUH64217.1 HTH-type transcriptional regulator MhqR [Thalassovita autumnalis]CUH74446.1 HTH-type transcriptional regulator MhqR [Thalassovita autumnalis]